ncbi:MAG: glycosyltransferase family 2 protein [Planctomycetales bacterium]|nr:glycosyltransferase family 2 protein [Planctomycetales bacterium]
MTASDRCASPIVRDVDGDEAAGSPQVDGADAEFLERIRGAFGEEALARLGVLRLPSGFKLSVVMPAYNERQTIAEIIRRVQAAPIPKEIIVVDDGSRDGTREILEELDAAGVVRLVAHERNQGKGAALRSGLQAVSGDIVVIQDADLEYNPADYPRLIQPLIDGRADVVYGSRFLGDTARVHLFWHRVANWLLTTMSNVTTNLNLTDMETGYKAFRAEAIAGIQIKQNGFGVEPELTAKFARRRLRIYETAVSYAGRDYASGKKIGLKDAFVAIACILRYAIAD